MAASPFPFPQRYQVNATAEPEGEVLLLTDGPPRPLKSLPPSAFGGPGDRWSPETLLVGAVADCFALTFRAVARAAELRWESLECEADGTLDRVDGATQFITFAIRAYLRIPRCTSEEAARRVLARAKDTCIVTHSLRAPCGLSIHIDVAESTEAARMWLLVPACRPLAVADDCRKLGILRAGRDIPPSPRARGTPGVQD